MWVLKACRVWVLKACSVLKACRVWVLKACIEGCGLVVEGL